MFFFLKDAGNGLYNLTEVCSTKKGNLTAKSFFKSKKKGISQRIMEIKDSLLPTSVTYSGEFLSSDAKIPTLFEINKGFATYINKEKARSFLSHQSAPIAAAAANEELVSAAKIVENFENPKIEGENSEEEATFGTEVPGGIEEVNKRFNERLSELVANPNQKNSVLHLGNASGFLRAGGLLDAEILLEFDKLLRKSRSNYKNNHPFDISDANNLPLAIHNPIAIFDNTNGKDAGRVILTELKMNGRNFIVVVQAKEQRRKGGVLLEINEISTLYPKEAKGVIKWLIDGNATNIDKNKALRFIEELQPLAGTTIKSEELVSATKIVENFENPKEKALDYLRISAPIAEAQDNQELVFAAKIVENFESPKIEEENSEEEELYPDDDEEGTSENSDSDGGGSQSDTKQLRDTPSR